MESKVKQSKTIPDEFLPGMVSTLYILNDGRIALGGNAYLSIYNPKTEKVDMKINLRYNRIIFMLQLSDNKIFYCTFKSETEGGYYDAYYFNYLIELTGNTHKDMTSILPPKSTYNLMREYSDIILFAGISYSIRKDQYNDSNASGPKRIEKLEKSNEDKYQITKSVNLDFIDFILLNKNLIAALLINRLEFYDVNELKKIKSSEKINNLYTCVKMAYFSENLILVGTTKTVEIFDYTNFKSIKSISCVYPIIKIYVNKNKVFIGESTRYYDNKITEYEMDENGNYKQIYAFNNPHNNELTDIVQAEDGKLITCDPASIKIWS
jgi:hypothetical protein